MASIGVGLLSYAHDNTSNSSSGTTLNNITSTIAQDALNDVTSFNQCSPQVFQVAESFYIVSIFYSFFSTLVSLYGTFELGIGWWKALWIGVKDVEDVNIGSKEKINAFLSRLYSAKLLLNISIWTLIIGLFFIAFCVMSTTAFALQWCFSFIALVFVMRATIIGLFLKLFRGIVYVLCCGPVRRK